MENRLAVGRIKSIFAHKLCFRCSCGWFTSRINSMVLHPNNVSDIHVGDLVFNLLLACLGQNLLLSCSCIF